jgi:hypothetical protein
MKPRQECQDVKMSHTMQRSAVVWASNSEPNHNPCRVVRQSGISIYSAYKTQLSWANRGRFEASGFPWTDDRQCVSSSSPRAAVFARSSKSVYLTSNSRRSGSKPRGSGRCFLHYVEPVLQSPAPCNAPQGARGLFNKSFGTYIMDCRVERRALAQSPDSTFSVRLNPFSKVLPSKFPRRRKEGR